MKHTHNSLKKLIYVILAELLFIVFFGTISFSFMYESETYSLRFPHIITIMFLLSVVAALATSCVFMFKANNIEIARIKKKYNPTRFSASLCAILMIVFFVYESIIAIVRSDMQLIHYVCRIVRWLLSLPACAYFVLELIPKRFKRTKINIPKPVKVLTSISCILWSVFGIFTVYFGPLLANDIAKISHIIVYAFISLFFLFEGQIENATPKFRPYIITALFCSVITFAFPLSMSISKIIGRYSVLAALSQPEHLICAAIGLYAFTKMFAILSTMYDVSEFRASSEHHRHHSSSSESGNE